MSGKIDKFVIVSLLLDLRNDSIFGWCLDNGGQSFLQYNRKNMNVASFHPTIDSRKAGIRLVDERYTVGVDGLLKFESTFYRRVSRHP